MYKHLLILIFTSVLLMSANNALSFDSTSILPLGNSWADDHELPLPIGFGIHYYGQEQEYDLSDLWVSIPGMESIPTDDIVVENRLMEVNLKLDAWILPFMNIFGVFGKLEGETNISLSSLNLPDMDFDYVGWVYGGGATLAYGSRSIFGSLTGAYTDTNLDIATSSVKSWIIIPKLGININNIDLINRISIYTGAMYQNHEEKHSGEESIIGFGEFSYKVKTEQKEAWNLTMGINAEIIKHLEIGLEGGFGSRSHGLASITLRF